jgi:hypothetical protein
MPTITGPLTIEAAPNASALTALGALTDNSGGTASTTLAAIDDELTGVDGTADNAAPLAGVNAELTKIANAIASLAAQINALEERIQ